MVHEFIWFACGLLTAYLMYKDKEQIPVVKALLVAFFGIASLIVWALFNFRYMIDNPSKKVEVKKVEVKVEPVVPVVEKKKVKRA